MLVDKMQWIVMDDGKEALVIPKEQIEQITDKLQGTKLIETKPIYE